MNGLQERAREMYVPGVVSVGTVAKHLGVSPTTVRRLLRPEYAEHLRRLSREAKQRRTGTCEDCGAETRYHGTATVFGHAANGSARYCHACAARRRGVTMRGHGPVADKLVALLDEPKGRTELRDALGLSDNHISTTLNRLVRQGVIVRVSRGVYARGATHG